MLNVTHLDDKLKHVGHLVADPELLDHADDFLVSRASQRTWFIACHALVLAGIVGDDPDQALQQTVEAATSVSLLRMGGPKVPRLH